MVPHVCEGAGAATGVPPQIPDTASAVRGGVNARSQPQAPDTISSRGASSADSAGAAARSSEISPKADTSLSQAAVSEGAIEGKPIEPSYRVVLRSLVYPGWGQLYNGQYIKALAVFATEATLLSMMYTESRHASRAYADHLTTHDPVAAERLYEEYSRHFDKRNAIIWWTTGFVLLSLADAYVDSHLTTFDEEFGEPKGQVSLITGGLWKGGFVGFRYLF